jgi:putative ABC transport system permease protein
MSLKVSDLLSITFHSLKGNPLRSALTTLGVFMGVAAVSASLQVRSISQAIIAAQLAERFAPRIQLGLEWRPRRDRVSLKLEDAEYLRQRLAGAQAITADNWVGRVSTVFRDNEVTPGMVAVTQNYLQTQGRSILAGRFFTAADFENYRPVAVIDQFLVDRLFKGENPVGQRIYARRRPYTVVGVLPTEQLPEEEPEGQLLIPLAVHSALTGDRSIDSLQVRPTDLRNIEQLEEEAKKLLAQRFKGQRFWSWNNVEDIVQQQKTVDLAAQALMVVAAISLLVGGVGIANVMIASVTERTPEIGLRRAIGATQYDVMLQFLLETTILSVLGGTIALATVHGLTLTVADMFKLPYEFETDTAIISLSAALLVGIGAGLPPALRASRLDPVKALHAE